MKELNTRSVVRTKRGKELVAWVKVLLFPLGMQRGSTLNSDSLDPSPGNPKPFLSNLPGKWFLTSQAFSDLLFPFFQGTEGAAEQEPMQLRLYTLLRGDPLASTPRTKSGIRVK